VVGKLAYGEQAELERATGSNDCAKALVLAQRKELHPSIREDFSGMFCPIRLVTTRIRSANRAAGRYWIVRAG
jgi:hypothetical protein